MLTGALNRICRGMYAPAYMRFMSPCNVRHVQLHCLGEYLRRNGETVYGRRYGFGKIKSYKEFAENVPLTAYEDYEPYIQRIARGEKNVLTAEDVMLFEPTSGSSGGRKLIPYTAALKAEFQAGIRPWLCDIYSRVKGVCGGKSYWSITPVTAGKEYTEAGIPIGFEEDSAYFGRIEQHIMKHIFAVDSSVKFSVSTEQFYHDTAAALLRCDDLSLISVWNPTFLTLLCGYIRDNANALEREMPQYETKLAAARGEDFDRVFPKLAIISCWADGSAAEDIPEVQRLFRDVYIQPKGLLSTECFASFPLVGEEGSRLSIYSHFFEFISLSDGRIYTADRLKKGEYELAVTTGGGFVRYRTGDIVEVMGVYPHRPPRIRFLRRKGITCDLCGEKLTEDFVHNICKKLGIAGSFCLLAPEGKGYDMYTTADISSDELEKALCESYHYDYCRRLGQLRAVRVVRVTGDPKRAYLEHLTAQGMRMGDIKPSFLSRHGGWGNVFKREEH